jgi:transporter family protein
MIKHYSMSWILFALLSALTAALVAIFSKIGLRAVDSQLATFLRAVVMTVFLFIVIWSQRKLGLTANIKNVEYFWIILAGIAGALSWLFYFLALQKGPTTPVAALDRLSVVFVLILSFIFLNEHITWKTITGAIMIALGAVLTIL